MAKYHLEKQTRIYTNEPYSGHSTQAISELPGYNGKAETDSLEEAIAMREKLQKYNPVGWNIWNSETGILVEGLDMFALQAANEMIPNTVLEEDEQDDEGAYAHDEVDE